MILSEQAWLLIPLQPPPLHDGTEERRTLDKFLTALTNTAQPRGGTDSEEVSSPGNTHQSIGTNFRSQGTQEKPQEIIKNSEVFYHEDKKDGQHDRLIPGTRYLTPAQKTDQNPGSSTKAAHSPRRGLFLFSLPSSSESGQNARVQLHPVAWR